MKPEPHNDMDLYIQRALARKPRKINRWGAISEPGKLREISPASLEDYYYGNVGSKGWQESLKAQKEGLRWEGDWGAS